MSTDKSLNPFALGGVVTGRQFTGRTAEIARLRDIVNTSQHAYLYAPRRYGKSSLLREALGGLIDARRIEAVWCDCWPTVDAQDLATRLAQDVVNRAGSLNKVAEWVKTAGGLFKRLRPTFAIGQGGANVSIEVSPTGQGQLPDLEDAVAAVGRLAAHRKRPTVLVLDEFQQVAQWNQASQAEATLRSAIQQLKGVSCLFAGSQRHLLQEMFTDRARPLFNLAAPFPLSRLSREEIGPWLSERFLEAGITLEATALERILEVTAGHPWATQYLAYFVWQEAAVSGARRVDDRTVAAALDRAVAVEDTLTGEKLAALTQPQRLVLAALAREPTTSPTAAQYLARHRLPPKSTVSQALRSLEAKGDVEHDRRLFLVADPMLGEWLRRQFR